MAFTRHGIVLALFCGIASAWNWGAHDLNAAVRSAKGDFADLTLQWQAGDCPIASFTLYTQTPGGEEVEETSTSSTHCTIPNKEFWTNYTVTLKENFLCGSESLTIDVFTGPGNPHKVTGVQPMASAVNASVTVLESFMPRPVDRYNVTWCSYADCKTLMFSRNDKTSNTFDFKLDNLVPNTRYSVTVVPEISYEGQIYRGRPYMKTFVTQDVELPIPSDIEAALPYDEVMEQEVKLTWKLEKSPFTLAFYNVTVTSDTDPTFVRSVKTEKPEALFTEMPDSAELTAKITPVFNISDHLLRRRPGIAKFETPHTDPEPTNFTYVNLSPTAIYAKWATKRVMLPNSVTYNFSYIDLKTNHSVSMKVPTTAVQLTNLTANTTYDVLISVISSEAASTDLEANFTTMEKDYAAPEDVKVTFLSTIPTGAAYNVTWTSDTDPVEPSTFRITSCNIDSNSCTHNETEGAQEALQLDYFGNYNLTVSAVYELNLNQTQIRTSRSVTVKTAGTEPKAVTNIKIQDVTATDAVLVWTAPSNVPKGLSRMYRVSDVANNIVDQTPTEQIKVAKLLPYSLYNISVQTSVRWNGQDYDGNQTFIQFYSDSAAPGAPASVETSQNVRTNTFTVVWTAPETKNGPIDFYEVITEDSEGNVVSNLTNLVGTNGTTVTLPEAHSDANFTVFVRAVNYNVKHQPLAGEKTNSTLLFEGIDVPTATVIKRSSNSLTFKVTPSNDTTDKTGLFFKLENARKISSSSPSDQIELKNLSAYTNETVKVYACYLPTFCSDAFIIDALTNVGGPSRVNNLTASYTNETNPHFNWTAPSILNGPLDGYIVSLTDLTNASVYKNDVLPANQTSFEYSTALEFEKYNFSVRGFNLDLEQNNSRVPGELFSILIKTTGHHAPKPENVTETNKTATSVEIQWEKPDFPGFNITCFKVEVVEQNYTQITNNTTFTVKNLKPYTNTTVRTSSCTSEISCGFPGEMIVLTAADVPSEPTELISTDITETEATLQWKEPDAPNGPLTGYKVAVWESDNKNHTWIEVREEAVVHKLSNLTASTKYTVQVIAYNSDEARGDLNSRAVLKEFSTASAAGFAWWIIVVVLLIVIAGAALGVVLYRRRNANVEDRDQLVGA